MKRLCASSITLVLVFASAGCLNKAAPGRQIIVLIDVSASIEPEAQESAFQAIEKIPLTLRRGDSLVVIPITGDAANESQGHIVRLALSEHREAYDQDLRRSADNLRRSLEATKAETMSSPGAHTDILGALQITSQEIQIAGTGRKTVIVLLSDLIQDDDQFDFKHDEHLKNEATAAQFAATLHDPHLSFLGAPVFLGRLRSRDLARLSAGRRRAIQAFWRAFLNDTATQPVVAEDGPGLMFLFLDAQNSTR